MDAEMVQLMEKKEKKYDRYKLCLPLFLLTRVLMGCIPIPGKEPI